MRLGEPFEKHPGKADKDTWFYFEPRFKADKSFDDPQSFFFIEFESGKVRRKYWMERDMGGK